MPDCIKCCKENPAIGNKAKVANTYNCINKVIMGRIVPEPCIVQVAGEMIKIEVNKRTLSPTQNRPFERVENTHFPEPYTYQNGIICKIDLCQAFNEWYFLWMQIMKTKPAQTYYAYYGQYQV